MHRLFVAAQGLSLVVASRVYFLVAVHGYLIVSASLVAEHGQSAKISKIRNETDKHHRNTIIRDFYK